MAAMIDEVMELLESMEQIERQLSEALPEMKGAAELGGIASLLERRAYDAKRCATALWWATYNSALSGLIAEGVTGGIEEDHDLARQYADRAHGEL